MGTNGTDLTQNCVITLANYSCSICKFKTRNKRDYTRHLDSKKHAKMVHNGTDLAQTNATAEYICKCGKTYKYSQGLSRHKKTCVIDETPVDVVPIHEEPNNVTSELMIDLLKQNIKFKELIKDQNKQFLTIVTEGIENTTNSNNTINHKAKSNFNFFLNELRKDALHIMDFVNTMKLLLQLSDLEKDGESTEEDATFYNEIIKNYVTQVVVESPQK